MTPSVILVEISRHFKNSRPSPSPKGKAFGLFTMRYHYLLFNVLEDKSLIKSIIRVNEMKWTRLDYVRNIIENMILTSYLDKSYIVESGN